MSPFNFRGLMAPVFTPFHSDGSLNLKIVPEYADFLKKSGVDGVLVNGTTGEGVSQTVEERELNAEAWLEACTTTKQTVMIQVGGTNLKDVQRLAAHAEKHGASSILCLADLFHRPTTADQLLDYLRIVGESAPNTPLLYYHIPSFTGINVNVVEMLEKAGKAPTLVGLKFTNTDLDIGAACLAVGNGKYSVFLGSDTILAAALTLGFDSAIGTTLNMMPKQNIDIVECIKNGDVAKAREIQKQLTGGIKAISKHGSWVGTMKSAMNMMTPINVGPVRDPLKMLTKQQVQEVKTELKAFNII